MITGFNTDVEHDGVVYHVQTEDKGLESPIILSLVYVGGAILASKRSPYHDLLGEGFDAAALGERLQRQHKLICAAITAGRIEDLKRLNRGDSQENGPRGKRARRGDAARPAPEAAPPAAPPSADVILQEPSPAADSAAAPPEVAAQAPPPPRVEAAEETTVAGQPAAPAPPAETPAEEQELIPVEIVGALHVNLLEERDYRAGEIVTLRVRVSRGHIESREAVADATVTVKILGTEFRPLILTSKTDQDGVAVIHAWLPRFTSGRAAILVRATSDGYSAELRRAVRHS